MEAMPPTTVLRYPWCPGRPGHRQLGAAWRPARSRHTAQQCSCCAVLSCVLRGLRASVSDGSRGGEFRSWISSCGRVADVCSTQDVRVCGLGCDKGAWETRG
jgi:hypothetical protein